MLSLRCNYLIFYKKRKITTFLVCTIMHIKNIFSYICIVNLNKYTNYATFAIE